LIIFSVILFNS